MRHRAKPTVKRHKKSFKNILEFTCIVYLKYKYLNCRLPATLLNFKNKFAKNLYKKINNLLYHIKSKMSSVRKENLKYFVKVNYNENILRK